MVIKVFSQQSSTTPQDDPFDKLLGHFGRWQVLIFGAVSLVKLSSGWVQMAILFLTPNLTFWCSNMTTDFANQDFLPLNSNWTSMDNGTLSNASFYDNSFLDTSFDSYEEVLNNTCYSSCNKYEYDAEPFDNTIISEWDLVCERRWLASFTQMVLQFGILIGSIVFGFLSDRYGRKNTFLFTITMVIAFGFVVPFAPTFTMFTITRFLLGMATAGTMVVSFVIVMETVGAKYRGIVGCLFQIPFIIAMKVTSYIYKGILGVLVAFTFIMFIITRFLLGMATAGTKLVSVFIVTETVGAKYRGIVGCLSQIPCIIGHMTVPLFAYYYRSWDQYSLAMAIPAVIYLGYFFILTESPRWLVSVGRVEEAAQIVKKAALINNRPTGKIEETLRALSSHLSTSTPQQKPNYSALISKQLRVVTASCCFVWLIAGMTFFGVNQYISQTSPDPFVSVAVAGAIQIPSNFFSMWLIAHFGRKLTTIFFLTFGGLCIIALGCVPNIFALTLTLGSLGVSFAAIVATTIYIYTTELYPTVVRNMGMGACSMSMRVGSMVAPFISSLSLTVPWLPTVIFGLAPILAALVCLCLPETKGRTLSDTLDEVENTNESS